MLFVEETVKPTKQLTAVIQPPSPGSSSAGAVPCITYIEGFTMCHAIRHFAAPLLPLLFFSPSELRQAFREEVRNHGRKCSGSITAPSLAMPPPLVLAATCLSVAWILAVQ